MQALMQCAAYGRPQNVADYKSRQHEWRVCRTQLNSKKLHVTNAA